MGEGAGEVGDFVRLGERLVDLLHLDLSPPKDSGRPAEPDARQSYPNIKTTAR